MEEAFRYERKAVVERAIEPVREIECAVLGNDDPVASVCGEIVPRGHDFYDYDAKYLDEQGAELRIPAPLDPALRLEAPTARGRRVHDGGVRRDGAGRLFVRGEDVWVNEINTIPGFTSISMYPKLWEASGLPYPALVQRLLDLAVERHDAEQVKRIDVPELHGARRPVADGAYRWTTGQVRVRVMPSTDWIRATTSLPRSSTVSASARTITS